MRSVNVAWLPLYVLHQCEEHGRDVFGRPYAFIAHLNEMFHQEGSRSKFPADDSYIFVVNVFGVWILLPLLASLALGEADYRRSVGLSAITAGIVGMNAVMHAASFVAEGGAYNPGLLTAALLGTVSAMTMVRVARALPAPTGLHVAVRGTACGVLVHFVLILPLPLRLAGIFSASDMQLFVRLGLALFAVVIIRCTPDDLPVQAYVLGTGSARIPETFTFDQSTLQNKFFEMYGHLGEGKKETARKLFEGVQVEKRAVIPPHLDTKNLFHNVGADYPKLLEQQFRPVFEDYLKTAGEKALENWGGDRKNLTHLFYGTDTHFQYALPSMATKLVKKLSLPSRIRVQNISNMGCCGGYQVLGLAAEVAKNGPRARILVIYGDLAGAQHAARQREPDNNDLLQFALFGDGAFAAVVGGVDLSASEHELLGILGWQSQVVEKTERLLSHKDAQEYVYSVVERKVPTEVTQHVPGFVDALVPVHVRAQAQHTAFLVHPGGPLILERVRDHFRLSEAQLEASWTALREHGNMAGCTNLAVLHYWAKLRATGQLPPFRWAVGLSFGPGITIQGILFHCCG